MKTAEYSPGLEGIIAGTTTISHVNPDLCSLMYRGYDIRELVKHSSFEEVAYLLLKGKLPTQGEYDEFCALLKQERDLPDVLVDAFKTFPKNSVPMDMLRTGTALLALHDPDKDDNSHDANVRKAIRSIAKFPALIAYSYRINRGQEIVKPDNGLGHGENFLYMLQGKKPDAYMAHVFDCSLICYADHGFNASTFSSRVTVSTLSDIYSGLVAAIGTLKGPLHGGANEEAMKMLQEVGTPENAEAWVIDALATKKKIMGFGHREYKNGDPRAFILTEMGAEMSEKLGDTQWYKTASIVESVMHREKNIVPNVDFPTSYIYYLMGLPIEIYTPIFALARVSGWTAHMIEQLDNNRLIRPKALYEGPDHLDFVVRAQR
ncbi:citrate/2-methylcitrate synthase [Vampirovibrio sp.]|uniref:citrate/2-methylcitrate synthase n=1 Tax=Vampirovibrio sp. TaxID=2717857 RepID=UPI0035939A53